MDEIDEFFSRHPSFDYNRSASSPKEFYRMCDSFGWVKDAEGHYPPERIEAYEAFTEAMVKSFNHRFGTDVHDEKSWEGICHLLSVDPLPDGVTTMKKVRTISSKPCHSS